MAARTKKTTTARKVSSAKTRKSSSAKARPKTVKKSSAKRAGVKRASGTSAAKKTTTKKTTTKKTTAKKTTAKKRVVKKQAGSPKKKVASGPAAGRRAKSAARKQPAARPASSNKSASTDRARKSSAVAPKKKSSSRRAEVIRVVGYGANAIKILDPEAPLPKSRMSSKALAQFREMLLAKRRELVGNVNHMTHEALIGRNSFDGHSSMPQHMADLGSDNWEQEFTLELLQNERGLVREIDEALARIDEGTYGICLATHRPIGRARLLAKPWAKYCIEFAQLKEQGRV